MRTITVTLRGEPAAEQAWAEYLEGELRYHLMNGTLEDESLEDDEVTYWIEVA